MPEPKAHILIEHTNCQQSFCMICEGGLSICKVCGGMEGSLLPECPGRVLTLEEDEANYGHYKRGTGPFANRESTNTLPNRN